MKSMKVKRYLQGLLLIICLLVTSCAQIIAVNADEQDVSLEITLEDESTPMEGVIFSMYQITDGITAPDGQSLKFMPDFEDCGYKTDVKTAKELVALSRRLKIWIDEKDIQPTYTLATDVTGRCSISSVPFGMYLIVPSSYDDYGPVVMSLVFLPGRDANGDLIYQNRIIPKHSIPEEDEPDGPTNPHESNSTTPEEQQQLQTRVRHLKKRQHRPSQQAQRSQRHRQRAEHRKKSRIHISQRLRQHQRHQVRQHQPQHHKQHHRSPPHRQHHQDVSSVSKIQQDASV